MEITCSDGKFQRFNFNKQAMRKVVGILCLILTMGYYSTGQTGQGNKARFEYFRYSGNDKLFQKDIDHENQYFNPILAGFYPDPSICRKGDTYYLVTSSFTMFPGVPIFKSHDLVNWDQVGHVLDRPSQLSVDGLQISQGIFAPAIQYNPHNETFYMITTSAYGIGNFYVKTQDPAKGWSDPVRLPQVRGIDPSVFIDDDGKGYILECAEPMGGADYQGQRGIHLHPFDVQNDRINGEPKEIVRGGWKPETKPIWLEAPHIFKVNGYYYLICAEGGTGLNHSEVVFRSKDVWGPYLPYSENPILTQRDLPEDRPDKITTAGHADFVMTEDGDWWAVFLGVRPYGFDMTNTGRDTYLLPVEWKKGWPEILPKGTQIPIVAEKPNLMPDQKASKVTGNFEFLDDFDSGRLDLSWMFIRTPREELFSFHKGGLELVARPVTLEERKNPSAIVRRQQHTTFTAETKLEFQPEGSNDFAGFTVFQNEDFHFVFGKTEVDGKVSLVVNRIEREKINLITRELRNKEINRPLYLRIMGDGPDYSFQYSLNGKKWITLVEDADGTNLSTRKAGGFIGALIGLYTTSSFSME